MHSDCRKNRWTELFPLPLPSSFPSFIPSIRIAPSYPLFFLFFFIFIIFIIVFFFSFSAPFTMSSACAHPPLPLLHLHHILTFIHFIPLFFLPLLLVLYSSFFHCLLFLLLLLLLYFLT